MRLRAALLALAALAVGPARAADVFSPGDLARPHAALAGLDNCTKCHPRGEQLSQASCLECHRELAPRVAAGKGFHGRLAQKDRDCWTCHHEHQGKDFALVDWGPGGEKRFDHAKTGAPLGGKHAAVACERCHDRRLLADAGVKKLLAEQPRRRSFLGAPAMTACASCHFDEHRGQLGTDCARCHSDAGWKPARGFDHARTTYPLTGAHARVACEKCHARAEAPPAGELGALTAPVNAAAFARYRPVAHASCLDCHKDPHQDRFGQECARCHTTDDWKRMVAGAGAERAFHQKTRYPLEGAHLTVACAPCHGPWNGTPARFKPLAFGACTDCHLDAHAGQLARGGPEAGRCERCHDVRGYVPPRFGLEEHARTRYPLQGAHAAVACVACHPHDERVAERVPAAARAELHRRGRPVRVSLAVYELAGDLTRCETCHADPHAGQLPRPQGCAACHTVDSFHKVKFDHQRESRFALTGKHAQAACGSCHRPAPPPSGSAAPGQAAVVRYRPLEQACWACHEDPHRGQFADARSPASPRPREASSASPRPRGEAQEPSTVTDCSRCHSTEAWKGGPFRHDRPFTEFVLAGKHQTTACEKCHRAERSADGVVARRYRGLSHACEACHRDPHVGQFAVRAAPSTALAAATANRAPTDCARCHGADDWKKLLFRHEKPFTDYPLTGKHQKVACEKCHVPVKVEGVAVRRYRPLPRACEGCHADFHKGAFRGFEPTNFGPSQGRAP